ncbi:MAG: hypothetical protein WBQ37_10465 [Candidatus Competibacter sp.]
MLDLADYPSKARAAIKAFWENLPWLLGYAVRSLACCLPRWQWHGHRPPR